MTADELLKLVEGIVVIVGVAAIVYSVFKNQTVKATIASQKELIETLTGQVNELRTLHANNEKAIAHLSGQVGVYKELPLQEIAKSLQVLETLPGDMQRMHEESNKALIEFLTSKVKLPNAA